MQCFQKYLNIFFMILFTFHSSFMSASEFTYNPFPNLPVVESTSIISDFYAENKTMVIASAAALLGCAALYVAKDKISEYAQKKCVSLEKELRTECAATLKDVENSSLKNRALLVALKPFAAGAQEYWEYNKIHLGVMGVLMGVGRLTGYSYSAGFSSFGVFVKGWWDQSWAAVQKVLEDIKKEMAVMKEENSQLHEVTRNKLTLMAADITSIKNGLEDHRKETQEVKKELSADIKAVGDQVIKLDKKLDPLAQQVLEIFERLDNAKEDLTQIKGNNAEIVVKNNEIIDKIDNLKNELTSACNDFAITSTEIGALKALFLRNMQDIADKVEKQNIELSQKIAEQTAEGKNTVDALNTLKASMVQGFEKCFSDVISQNQLLTSFQQTQKDSVDRLNRLSGIIKKIEKKVNEPNESVSKIIDQILAAEEKRISQTTRMVSGLEAMCEKNTQAVDVCCFNMQEIDRKLNARMDKLEEKVDENHLAMTAKVDGNTMLLQNLQKSVQIQVQQIDLLKQQNDLMKNELLKLREEMGLLRNTADENLKVSKDTQGSVKKVEEMVIKYCPYNPEVPTLTYQKKDGEFGRSDLHDMLEDSQGLFPHVVRLKTPKQITQKQSHSPIASAMLRLPSSNSGRFDQF